jgi:uncharacterized delta-60 repeat protein
MHLKFTHALGLTALLFCFSYSVAAQDGKIDSSFGVNGRIYDLNSTYYNADGSTPLILVLPDGKILHITANGSTTQLIRYNADGSRDVSFGYGVSGTGGGSLTHPGGNAFTSVSGAFLLPDGKFLVSGHQQPYDKGLLVIRFNANGAVDRSFGVYGEAHVKVGSTYTGGAQGMAVQADGKIVLVGSTQDGSESKLAVARFNHDGTPDPTFDGDGKLMYNIITGGELATDVAVQPDGKIVVGGHFINQGDQYHGPMYDLAVVRFNPDGSVDNGFATGGIYKHVNGASQELMADLAVGPDGSIYFAWNSNQDYEYYRAYLNRLWPNGTYAGGTDFIAGAIKTLTDMRIQADGKVLVAGYDVCPQSGYFTCPVERNNNFYIARVHPNATMDPTFADKGIWYVEYNQITAGGQNFYTNEKGGSLQSQGNKLLIGGYVDQTNFTFDQNFNKVVSSREQRATVYRLHNSSPLLPENPVAYFQDTDGDGYGNSGSTINAYSTPNGYSARWGDCNDANASVNPGAAEVLNGLDDNCNGQIDEGLSTSTYVTIPAKIEAENYTAMNGVQKEATQDAGGGENVGYIDLNDWMDYNISSPQAGTYTLNLRVASTMSGGRFEVRSSAGAVLASIDVPNTGGWQNWTTLSVPVTLPQGAQTVRLVSTSTSNWNINWLEFALPGNYVTIPAKIEAEAYTNHYGTQNESTSDAGGGQNVGYIDQGDYLEYNIHVPTAGAFNFTARVASTMSGGQFDVRNSAGQTLATITVPITGGWQAWTDVTTILNLPAGNQVLRLVSTSSANWNINYMIFSQDGAGYVQIPARIEAEQYTDMSGVQKEATADAGGGENVGYIDQGDWMEYKVSVRPGDGSFLFSARVASLMSGGQFQLRNSAGTVLATLNVPNTGDWQNWTFVSAQVTLPEGNQTVRIVSTSWANWNINWFQFDRGSGTFTSLKARPITDLSTEGTGKGTVGIYPNPVRDAFNLELDNAHNGNLRVEVVNITGKVEKGFSLSKASGKSRHNLSLAGLAKGTYILRITSGGVTQTQKLIKL